MRALILLGILLLVAGDCVAASSDQQPIPQVIIVSEKTHHCAWHEGMTVGEVLTKIGGTSAGGAFLIRSKEIERVRIPDDMKRELQAWDILLVGYHPPDC